MLKSISKILFFIEYMIARWGPLALLLAMIIEDSLDHDLLITMIVAIMVFQSSYVDTKFMKLNRSLTTLAFTQVAKVLQDVLDHLKTDDSGVEQSDSSPAS